MFRCWQALPDSLALPPVNPENKLWLLYVTCIDVVCLLVSSFKYFSTYIILKVPRGQLDPKSWTAWATLSFSVRPVLMMVMVSTCWPVRPETQRGKRWVRQRLLRDMSSCVPQFWEIPCGNSFCRPGVGRTSWNGQDVAGCWSNIHRSCSSCRLNILEGVGSLVE